MVKDHTAIEETRCRHMGYSFRLAARFFYMHHPTDRITLAGTRNSSMGPRSEVYLHGRAFARGAMGLQIDPSWWTQ